MYKEARHNQEKEEIFNRIEEDINQILKVERNLITKDFHHSQGVYVHKLRRYVHILVDFKLMKFLVVQCYEASILSIKIAKSFVL